MLDLAQSFPGGICTAVGVVDVVVVVNVDVVRLMVNCRVLLAVPGIIPGR